MGVTVLGIQHNFYPRSPCGERQKGGGLKTAALLFLSTLSLRRATQAGPALHRLQNISIHALLAESDPRTELTPPLFWISIHALLAESDGDSHPTRARRRYFYPRSPCGERHEVNSNNVETAAFLSTLSLRRATRQCGRSNMDLRISIHALLAESD